METITLQAPDSAFIKEVEERSGQKISECYQCGNCTGGCPYNFAYDIPVSRIMRLVQTGQRDTILSSRSLWLCASCQTCTTRCPNNIDVARVVDVLRHMAREAGYATERRVKAFGDAFIESVEKHGRVHEIGVVLGYVRRTGHFWGDMDISHKILPKGKLHLKPHSIKGASHVAEIIRRYREGSK